MDEIRIQDVSDIRIGQAEDKAAGTGCTVFIRPEGMRAGLLKEDKKTFRSSPQYIEESIKTVKNRFANMSKMNTTLAVLITNAYFEKPQLCKIAGMGQDGLARSIRPVHTSLDGDTVYAVSAGDLIADQEVVGTLAAEVISEAIINAVISAESAYGFPAARDLLVLNY